MTRGLRKLKRETGLVLAMGVLAALLVVLCLLAGEGGAGAAPMGALQLPELPASGPAAPGAGPRAGPQDDAATAEQTVREADRACVGAGIHGRTLHSDGTPMPGVAVRCSTGAATRSDQAGRFWLGGLAAGSCSLVAQADGYASVPSGRIVVRGNETIDGVDLILDRVCFVTGRISASRGEPLAEARVSGRLCAARSCPDLPGEALSDTARLTARTDGEGRFRLGPFPPGWIELNVEHETHIPFARRYPSDAANTQIMLERAASVSGVVLDPDGQRPAVLERVLLLAANPTRGGWSLAGAVTPDAADAAAGRFHLAVPIPRDVRVVAVTRDFAPASSEPFRVPRSAAHGPLQLRASRGTKVAGRIHDKSGAPVAGAELHVRGPEAVFEAAHVTTGADGMFALGLGPGRYVVRIEKPGFSPRQLPIEIVAGQPAPPLDCELEQGATLAGRILHVEGATLPALEVLALLGDGARARPAIALVRDGSYAFDHLPPGDYRVALRERGDPSMPGGGESVQVAAGESARLDLAPRTVGLCRLGGKVTRDGSALPFATVRLARAGDKRRANVIADRFGRFEFDGLAAGALTITVSHGVRGPELGQRTLELHAGDERDEPIEVAYGSLGGQIVAAGTRTPLANIRVDVFAGDGRGLATTRSDAAGRFELPVVMAGDWILGFSRPGESTCRQQRVQVDSSRRQHLPDVEL